MIGGRLDHYRSSLPRLDTTMLPAPDATARHGAAAEPWLAGYRVITDHGDLAASYAGTRPLRIRPITYGELILSRPQPSFQDGPASHQLERPLVVRAQRHERTFPL